MVLSLLTNFSCVRYRRDVLLLPPNETKSIASTGYGIASVFTPEKHRGKGYAARMMSLLHFAIANPNGVPAFPAAWGDAPPTLVKEPAILSVLYSGIGDYYSRCSPGEGTGWTIVNPWTTEWVVGDTGNISARIDPSVEMLSQEQAVATIVADVPLYIRDFESRGPSERIQFAFQPTAGWCVFQMVRDTDHPRYLASPPKTWGARIQSQGETHFIVWTYKPLPEETPKLIVVNLRASPATFRLLFAAMLSAAQEEKHGLIEAWNVDEELGSIVEETRGRTYERKSQLPAVKWYGPGPEGNVAWFGNNKCVLL